MPKQIYDIEKLKELVKDVKDSLALRAKIEKAIKEDSYFRDWPGGTSVISIMRALKDRGLLKDVKKYKGIVNEMTAEQKEDFKKDYANPEISVEEIVKKYSFKDATQTRNCAQTLNVAGSRKMARKKGYSSDYSNGGVDKKIEQILKMLRQTPRIHIDEAEKKTGLSKQRIFAGLTALVKKTHLDISVSKKGFITLGIKPLAPLEALDINFLAEKRGLWRPYITIAAVTGLDLGHRNQTSEVFYRTFLDHIAPQLKVDFSIIDGGFALGNLSKARLGETMLDEFGFFKDGCPTNGRNNNGQKTEAEKPTVEKKESGNSLTEPLAEKITESTIESTAESTENKPKKLSENLPGDESDPGDDKDKKGKNEKAETKPKLSEQLFEAQVEYISHYFPESNPTRKIGTYLVGGLEEASFRNLGFNILEAICNHRLELGKDDLFYRGDGKAFFRIINAGSPVSLWVLHTKRKPFRGAYTRGHRPRRTALALADWFQETLQKQKESVGYPRVVIWTDGSGVETHQKIADIDFITLPRLNPLDQNEIDANTGTPNIGIELIRLWFDEKGNYDHTEVAFFKFSHLIPLVQQEIEKNLLKLKNGCSCKFSTLEKKILDVLKHDGASISDLARDPAIKDPEKNKKARIEKALENVAKKGLDVTYDPLSNRWKIERKPLTSFKALPKKYFFGSEIIWETSLWFSDPHFGLLQAQPHLMVTIGELGEKFKVSFYGAAGDILTGLKHSDENILNKGEWQRKLAIIVLSLLNKKDVYLRPGGHDHWASLTEGVRLLKDAVDTLNAQGASRGEKSRYHYIDVDDLYQFTSPKGITYEMLHLERAASKARTTAVQGQREDRTPEYLAEGRRNLLSKEETDLRQEIQKARPRRSRKQPLLSAAGNWHRDFSYVDGDTLELVMAALCEETKWEIDKGHVHDLGIRIATIGKNKDDKLVFASRQYIDLRSFARRITLQDHGDTLLYMALTLASQPDDEKWNNILADLIKKGDLKPLITVVPLLKTAGTPKEPPKTPSKTESHKESNEPKGRTGEKEEERKKTEEKQVIPLAEPVFQKEVESSIESPPETKVDEAENGTKTKKQDE